MSTLRDWVLGALLPYFQTSTQSLLLSLKIPSLPLATCKGARVTGQVMFYVTTCTSCKSCFLHPNSLNKRLVHSNHLLQKLVPYVHRMAIKCINQLFRYQPKILWLQFLEDWQPTTSGLQPQLSISYPLSRHELQQVIVNDKFTSSAWIHSILRLWGAAWLARMRQTHPNRTYVFLVVESRTSTTTLLIH